MKVLAIGLVLVLAGCIIRSSEPVTKKKTMGRVLDNLFDSGRLFRFGDEVEDVKRLAKKWDNAARTDATFDDLGTILRGADNELGELDELLDAIIRGGQEAVYEFKRPVIELFNDIDYRINMLSDTGYANTKAGEALVKEVDGNLDKLWKRIVVNHLLSGELGERVIFSKEIRNIDSTAPLLKVGDEIAAELRVAESDILGYSKSMDKWEDVIGSLTSQFPDGKMEINHIKLTLQKSEYDKPLYFTLSDEQSDILGKGNPFDTSNIFSISDDTGEASNYFQRMLDDDLMRRRADDDAAAAAATALLLDDIF